MKYLENILIKNQQDRLFCVANPEGFIVELTPRWTEKLGWEIEELTSSPIVNFIHPKDIPSTLKAMKAILTAESIKYEHRFQSKNGEYLWLSWISSIASESNLIFSVIEDITISKRNEFFQQDIQKNLKIGDWELDLETNNIYWSEMCHVIHETDPKTFKPKLEDTLKLYHQKSVPIFKNALVKLVNEGIPFSLELKVKNAKGKNIWISATGDAKIVDEKVQRVYGTFQDITESHQSKEQIYQLLHNCPVMIYQYKLFTDGRTSFPIVSDYSNEIYGIDPQEFISTPSIIEAFVHPDDQKELYIKIEESAKNLTIFIWEGRIITYKNILKWIKARAIPEREDDGSIRWDGAIIEITEEVEMQKDTAFILKSFQIGKWNWDVVNNIMTWDEGMLDLYGLKAGEFEETFEGWLKFLSDDSKSKFVNEFTQIKNAGNNFINNFKIITNKGETRYFRNQGVVVRNRTNVVIKMYGLNSDRTKEALLEKSLELERAKSQQSAKLASLGEMSAAIAHEINNPLAIISGVTSTLKKSIDDPKKFESRVFVINKSVNRIVKIINGLKKFTRVSSSKLKSVFKLSEIINESVSLTEVKFKHSETKVILDIKSNSTINCDDIEIEQVIVNLINNAIDAVKNLNQKWVKIKLYDEKSEVVLRVIDSGSGIPKNIVDKMFEPFFTTKPIGEGTGLGLSISKGIIEDHHGSISLTSEEEHTCFEIRFPIV